MSYRLLQGDVRERLAEMEASSVDAIVTDPPYFLGFMQKGWDTANPKALACDGLPGSRGHGREPGESSAIARRNSVASQVWHQQWAEVALRVAKPGAHMVAFGGDRTHHRLFCAIEDAGWEIRPFCVWAHGQGFPKSHSLHGEWEGWGTALKPALEPICLARKPLEGTVAENVQKWGVGALNIDGCRVACDGGSPAAYRRSTSTAPVAPGSYAKEAHGQMTNRMTPERYRQVRQSEALGRWPANLLHDGSAEVLDLFPQSTSGANPTRRASAKFKNAYGEFAGQEECEPTRGAESGSAARFYYCAKASRRERGQGNTHPTVKPLDLMRWLIRLVCPPGGLVLDPFAGSGTTAIAARAERMRCVLIERKPEYVQIAQQRITGDAPLFYQETA